MERVPNLADPAFAQSLLERAPTPVLVLDVAQRLGYTNAAGRALLGLDDAAVGRSPRVPDLAPAFASTAFQGLVEQARTSGASAAPELHVGDRCFSATLARVAGDVVVYLTDITVPQQLAVDGARAVERTRAIINAAPQLVLALDTDLTVLALNRAYADEFARIFGGRIGVGDNLRTALAAHPEARAEAVRRWERAVRGEEFTLHRELGADGQEPQIYEIRYGTLRDDAGRIFGAVSLMNDVTALIRDRSAMAELTERLDAVIRYSPDRVVGVDKDLRVVAMNEHAKADFASLWGVPIAVGDSLRERLQTLPPTRTPRPSTCGRARCRARPPASSPPSAPRPRRCRRTRSASARCATARAIRPGR